MRPNEFYVGVIDFFAVLVPGSIATAILAQIFHKMIIELCSKVLQGQAEKRLAFLVCAYFIGHLIFLIGSYMDEHAYEPLRKWLLLPTKDESMEGWLKNLVGKQEKSICGSIVKKIMKIKADDKKALERATRLLQLLKRLFLKVKSNQKAYEYVEKIRNDFFIDKEKDTVNVLQWARSILLIACPEAAEEVRRFEADSKFFRSLIVVGVFSAGILLYRGSIVAGIIILVLPLFCFIRYFERRLKAMTQACIHVITLRQLNKLPNSNFAS